MVTNNTKNTTEKLRALRKNQYVSANDVGFISACLIDPDILVRSVAVRTTGYLKVEKLLPALIDAMSYGGEYMSFPDSVATFGVKVIPMLEKKLKQKNNITFRKNVAFVLGRLRIDKSVEILKVLARDVSPKVRRIAALELGYIAGDKV